MSILDKPKVCLLCGKSKPRREFYPNRATIDGFHEWCKEHDKVWARWRWPNKKPCPNPRLALLRKVLKRRQAA